MSEHVRSSICPDLKSQLLFNTVSLKINSLEESKMLSIVSFSLDSKFKQENDLIRRYLLQPSNLGEVVIHYSRHV